MKKINFLNNGTVLNVLISLDVNETKEIKLFYLRCPCDILLSIQVIRI